MRRCKVLGYRIRLIFAALENADLHIRRVHERVDRGGHAIPEDVIRRRYDTSFQRLTEALEIADQITLIDNSGFGARVVLAIEDGHVVQSNVEKERPLDAKFVEAAQLYSEK
ncbi:hypothetical protein [Georhizobium sp. MAB10]|uniref:hypothetical protein n=1 Tax=Georhizobium sp. MAB10 TaxID=3028319 RepID=UPI003855B513